MAGIITQSRLSSRSTHAAHCEELIDDLNVCEDEGYLPTSELSALKQHGWRVYQLINGYIRYFA